jgi:hypothetical protein
MAPEGGTVGKGEAIVRRVLIGAMFSLAALYLADWPAAAQVKIAGAPAPEIAGGPWINSGPLTTSTLKGRVMLVEFWTFG